MRRAFILVVAVAVAGCGSNPCDGRGASCVNALVQGYTGTLDQLRISIDKPSPSTTTTPTPPSSFTLPVKVALVLPPGTAGTVAVGIDGLSSGQVVANAPPQSVTLPSSGTVTFTLASGGGGADLSVPPADLAGIVSVVPSSFNFAVDRGASDVKTFHFGNGSGGPVAAQAGLAGDGAFTISNDGCAGAMIADGAGCDVTVTFAPTTSGMGKATTLTIAGATASITGDANPAWTSESPSLASATTFNAMAALSATQQLAGGANPNAYKIFGSSGTTWSQFGSQPIGNNDVNGLAPADGGALLIASPTGVLRGSGSTFTNELPTADGGAGNGMTAVIAGSPVFGDVAVGALGIFRNPGTGWINAGPGQGDAGVVNVNAVTTDGTSLFCVSEAGILYRGYVSANVVYYYQTSQVANAAFKGVWVPAGAGPSNVWIVADGTPTIGGIYHIDAAFPSGSPMHDTLPASATSALSAIHGFRSGSTLTVIAVGNGGLIVRSSGNGTWTQDKSPTTANLHAVLVTSLTEAYAAGDAGTILHYY